MCSISLTAMTLVDVMEGMNRSATVIVSCMVFVGF